MHRFSRILQYIPHSSCMHGQTSQKLFPLAPNIQELLNQLEDDQMPQLHFLLFFPSQVTAMGGNMDETTLFSSPLPFHFFITNPLLYSFSHNTLTQHVSNMFHPITFCPLSCSWPATTNQGGKLTCKSTLLITCTNRSLQINLSHFKSVTHKSYQLNSHAID